MAHRNLGKAQLPGEFGERLLVDMVAIAVQQDDGDRAHALGQARLEVTAGRGEIERLHDRAVGAHPLLHLDHIGIEELGEHDLAGEDVRSVLIADAQRVAQALRDREDDRLALSLEQGIGRDGGAHLDRLDLLGRQLLSRLEPKQIAHTLREDGAYVEAGENDNLIVQKLGANPNALGIFGFSFLDQNSDRVQGSIVDGVAPTFDAIASGEYKVSRSLFFYVKKAHIGKVPGLEEYVAEFTSDRASGEEGYLAEKGLIPLPDADRMAVRKSATSLALLQLE